MRTVTKRATLVMAWILVGSVAAQADRLHARMVVVPHRIVYAPFFYDPFWSWGWDDPYFGYPNGVYPSEMPSTADVKVQVTPKQADVYVDGYLAGVAGELKRVHATPGGHAITVRLEGYRTVTQNVYLAPGSSYTLHEAMEKLAPGEVSAPAPAPSPKR